MVCNMVLYSADTTTCASKTTTAKTVDFSIFQIDFDLLVPPPSHQFEENHIFPTPLIYKIPPHPQLFLRFPSTSIHYQPPKQGIPGKWLTPLQLEMGEYRLIENWEFKKLLLSAWGFGMSAYQDSGMSRQYNACERLMVSIQSITAVKWIISYDK